MSIDITYLFDPLCGWCYGGSPAIAQLAATPGVRVRLAPTGLFSGTGARDMDDAFAAYAWQNDQRIGRLTGQPFRPAYRERVLGNRVQRFDSGPVTRALTAVALTQPERELDALKAIQHARYVQGLDVTDAATLAAVLTDLNLPDAAAHIDHDHVHKATAERTQAAQQQMQHFGAQGVPTLLVQDDDTPLHLVRGNVLFGTPEGLLDRLRSA